MLMLLECVTAVQLVPATWWWNRPRPARIRAALDARITELERELLPAPVPAPSTDGAAMARSLAWINAQPRWNRPYNPFLGA